MAIAFNCIDHTILFRKMRDVGMSNRVIDWFKSYLTRSQKVKYGDTVSSSMEISNGIAQGTVLGPLIFIFYLNDCVCVLDKVKISMFADDCVLYYSANNWQNIQNVMQKELDNFVEWTTKHSLSLNESKTQAMIVGTRKKLSKVMSPTIFIINGKQVKFVKQYNYLGIILDNELTLTALYKSIEKNVLLTRFICFILISCNKDKKKDFQVIQNDVLRFCENKRLKDRVSIEMLHKKAKFISLEQRRVKQVLGLMFKISKDVSNIVIPARNTRLHQKKVFKTETRVGTKYANAWE